MFKNSHHFVSALSLTLLVMLGIAWELIITPQEKGSFIFACKILPLVFAVKGIYQANLYTMQWSSMLVLIYFTEGIVRATSDTTLLSRSMAGLEIVFSLLFFISTLMYVRPYKKIAKAQFKAQHNTEKQTQE